MASKVGGGESIEWIGRCKVEVTQIIVEAGFASYKWHSNVRAMELDEVHEELKEMSVRANYNIKIVEISWNKSTDTLELDFRPCI